jgi:hypothetical protein
VIPAAVAPTITGAWAPPARGIALAFACAFKCFGKLVSQQVKVALHSAGAADQHVIVIG